MRARLFLRRLELRRQKIGMSMVALAKRSGVSLATVQRILSRRHSRARFASVMAVASALGVDLDAQETMPAYDFVREGAMEKARRLVGMVQGTSGLDAQAVDAKTLDKLTDKAFYALMAGSRRKVWAD